VRTHNQTSPPDQAKIEPFRQRMGATVPWYSSFGSDFNYDFHITLDEAIAPGEYNYRSLAELGPEWQGWSGEMFGVSAFLRTAIASSAHTRATRGAATYSTAHTTGST
jgi:predicted dithiol-disulfide oxidoreductase (DUF899 family)